MATGFNDSLQMFVNGTGGTSTTGDNTLVLPEGSETLSDLIKLNYDFPVEPNVPLPPSYNIYIWNNNNNGEIRFYTKDAKNNNDYNKDFFSGNYSEPRLNFNTKIGKDGKLYYWHNYTTATNPTKLSGWYELDSNFNSIDAQLIILEAGIGANSILINNLITAIADIVIVDNTQNGNITTLFTNIGIIETRLTYLETDNTLDEFAGYSPVSVDYEAISEAVTQRREVQRLITQAATIDRQTALREVNAKYGSTLSSFINSSIQSIAGLGLIAAVFVALREISDNQKKTIYEDEMVAINNSLSIIPVSLSNNTINHTGLTIVSGNGGFPPASLNKEFSVPIQRNAVLKFGIDSSLNAYIIVVDKAGDTYFTVGESISINKNLINGGTGTLVLTVSSLGTLKEWTELKTTYLQNKINKINTKNRRKNLVVGHDDVNTDQFTNVNATYTDYDEQGAETITYKVLKSRINLLPTGTNDVDLYTSTGKVGIGTIPTTKLHVFDDITNETKLTIQNTSNILLQTPSSSSIDLNITDNAVIDYNVGNYDGNFKIISKNGGSITDQIVIDSSGRIGIGTPPSAVHKLYVNGAVFSDRYIGFNVNVGKLSNIELNVYKATNPTIRIESDEGGTPILELMKGTTADVNKDYRFISENETLKLQYQDNLTLYTNDSNQLLSFNNVKTVIHKNLECSSNVGIGTEAHATIKLDVNGNSRLTGNLGIGTEAATELHIYKTTNPAIRIQSLAEGTPSIDFMRGVLNDVNKDFRIVSDTDTFKLQYQDNINSYGNNNNQLIWANATDTIIHKPTEFKANVLIGGDTRTVGYVGIGTTASTALHVYTAAANILRLQTAPVNGTNSIEFMRGNSTDPLTDYRIFTNLDGKFKIQYANNLLAYGDAETDLIELSTTNTIIYKPTEIKGNVGIGTTPHATHKVDVVGTVNATAFIGNGAGLTDLGADKITTGSLNLDRITLTTSKLYQNFNTTNFAIINDKIDLPPNYSINITDYDSQTLFGLSTERKYKGKMTANYDDRNGVYKLITTDNRTNNVAVLNYKVGDKISIRNTATVANDYLLESGGRYYNSLLLIKRPNNIPLNWAVNDAHNVLLYEWNSSDGLEGRPEARVRTPTNRYFPFTTVMTFLIEAGFNYYLCKLYNTVEVSGSSLIVVASGYGDDYNDFNRAFGAGQTFKLQITGTTFADDYLPTEYIGADIGIASDRRLGGVKKGRGVAIDATTGALDATPVSVDLINSMNTSHFTNNTGTNKIDISSTYVAPSATKLATARNIAGVSFDGSGAIDIPYFNLIHKIGVGSGLSITTGSATTSPNITLSLTATEIPDLGTGKITSGTFDIARIPDLGTGKITSGTFDIARIPDMATGKITSGTFDIARIPDLAISKITNLQTGLDAKQATLTAGTGISIVGTTISSTSSFTPTSANLIGVFNATQFENVSSAIQIKSSLIPAAQVQTDWNATTGMGVLLNKPTILTMTDINNTSNYIARLDGHTSNYVARVNTALGTRVDNTSNYVARVNTELLTAMGTLQPTINSTAGQLIIGNGNGFTTTSTGLTWAGGTTNRLTATNIATTSGLYPNFIDCSSTIRGEELRVYGYGLVVVGNSSTLMRISNNTNNELRVQQTLVAANDVKFSIFQRDNNVEYATPNITFYKGVIGIGTTTPATYPLTVGGDINITGNYRVNGALLDYFALNNRPIILQPTTTNLQLVSGYTFSVPSNLAVGTTAIATNILQVGAGGRLRISNGTTDYTLLGTLDTDGSTNTSIVISGTTRSTNAGNIQYLATASGGSHIFYTASATTRMTISSSGVNVNNDLGVSGNVGVGVGPATYKLNVAGDINCTGAFRINGTALSTGSRWSLTPSTNNIFYNAGNVGIGTTNASQRLHITHPSNSLVRIETDTNAVSQISGIEFGIPAFASSTRSKITSTTEGSDSSVLAFHTSTGTGGSTERMKIWSNGAVGIQTTGLLSDNNAYLSAGALTIGNRNQNYGGNSGAVANLAGFIMECADNTEMAIHDNVQAVHSFMRYTSNGNFTIGRNMGWGVANTYFAGFVASSSFLQGAGGGGAFRFLRPDGWCRLQDGGGTHVDFAAGQLYAHSQITGNYIVSTNGITNNASSIVNYGAYYGQFYSVSMTGTDYLCIQVNTGYNTNTNEWIRVAYGSFTAFHRCYTDDELYNNESDESIDLFKNNYMGRVVIATGKIKTDYSRPKETEPEPEPEPEIDSMTGLPQPNKPQNKEEEWYSEIDKDGISIEDAIPVVTLSRKKKDKRVFGVLGLPKRSTNNRDRLIVNSIGEGGICVANTNGNIENGDYLQSSDLLGYGEKQDDDLLHNYTIGKATIDCDFQLDSPYYQCHEIENGVRVAFIACTYHCG